MGMPVAFVDAAKTVLMICNPKRAYEADGLKLTGVRRVPASSIYLLVGRPLCAHLRIGVAPKLPVFQCSASGRFPAG